MNFRQNKTKPHVTDLHLCPTQMYYPSLSYGLLASDIQDYVYS